MSTKRISLLDGMKRDESEPSIEAMRAFVRTGSAQPTPKPTEVRENPSDPALAATRPLATEKVNPPASTARPSRIHPVALVPVTVRLRPELAGALKRASLERELAGEPVYTQQDIVEAALIPWLKKAGVL